MLLQSHQCNYLTQVVIVPPVIPAVVPYASTLDPMLQVLSMSMHGPILCDPAWVAATAGGEEFVGQTRVVRGFKPESRSYSYLRDCLEHRALFAFLHKDFEAEQSLRALHESGEQQVKHISLHGIARSSSEGEAVPPQPHWEQALYNLTGIKKFASPLSLYSLVVKSGGNYSVGGRLPGRSFYGYTQDVFENIRDAIEAQAPLAYEMTSNGSHIRVEVDNVVVSGIDEESYGTNNSTELEVSYQIRVKTWSFFFPGSPFWFEFGRNNTIRIVRVTENDTPPINLGANYPSGLPFVNPAYIVSLTSVLAGFRTGTELQEAFAGYHTFHELDYYSEHVCATRGITPTWSNNPTLSLDQLESYFLGVLADWSSKVEKDHPNIVPITFYAMQSAIQDYTQILASNNIENLSQLESTILLIPSLVDLYYQTRNRKYNRALMRGQQLAKVLSNLVLTANYSVIPTGDDIGEFVENWDRIVDKLEDQSLYGVKILHGRKYYPLPDTTYGLSAPFVVGQSRPVMNFDGSALLATVLTPYSVGLLPTLSYMWACLPYSFLVDLIYAIGAKLEAIDTSILVLLMPHLFTTDSYTVHDWILPDKVEALGIKLVTDGILCKYYNRWTSVYLPTIREGKYDFTSPGDIPVGTVGALAYQAVS